VTSANQYEEPDSETLRLDHEFARARSLERMTVHLADDRLLRKPATKQRRRIAEQRERLRAEAARQLAGREPHDGEVSVEIAVLAGEDLQPPQARAVVKAYLDLLIGLAYHDDRQIAHLIVSRSALDHPAMIAGIKRYGREGLSGPRTLRTPRVLIGIEPVEQYTFAYDRARRLAEQERDRCAYDYDDDERPPSPCPRGWRPPWRRPSRLGRRLPLARTRNPRTLLLAICETRGGPARASCFQPRGVLTWCGLAT
jgi:hypothetical protein